MSFVFNKAKAQLGSSIDWANDTIKVMAVSVAPDKDMDFVSQISANEVSGTNYSRLLVTGRTIVEDDANDSAYFKGDAIVWNDINTNQMVGVVLYKEVTNDTDSVLIAYLDNGFPITPNGINVTITGDVTKGYFSSGDSLAPQTKDILTDDTTYPTDTDKVTALKTLYGV